MDEYRLGLPCDPQRTDDCGLYLTCSQYNNKCVQIKYLRDECNQEHTECEKGLICSVGRTGKRCRKTKGTKCIFHDDCLSGLCEYHPFTPNVVGLTCS